MVGQSNQPGLCRKRGIVAVEFTTDRTGSTADPVRSCRFYPLTAPEVKPEMM